jgi:hypothetical protein
MTNNYATIHQQACIPKIIIIRHSEHVPYSEYGYFTLYRLLEQNANAFQMPKHVTFEINVLQNKYAIK